MRGLLESRSLSQSKTLLESSLRTNIPSCYRYTVSLAVLHTVPVQCSASFTVSSQPLPLCRLLLLEEPYLIQLCPHSRLVEFSFPDGARLRLPRLSAIPMRGICLIALMQIMESVRDCLKYPPSAFFCGKLSAQPPPWQLLDAKLKKPREGRAHVSNTV